MGSSQLRVMELEEPSPIPSSLGVQPQRPPKAPAEDTERLRPTQDCGGLVNSGLGRILEGWAVIGAKRRELGCDWGQEERAGL